MTRSAVVAGTLGIIIAACHPPAGLTRPANPAEATPCRVHAPEIVEDSTPLGQLRERWRAAAKRQMQTYDEVMAGVRPAFEGVVWLGEERHGPVFGILRDEPVDGVLVHQLQLDGPVNTRITIAQRTPRQAGAFLIQVPEAFIECSDCVDLDRFLLPPNLNLQDHAMTRIRVSPENEPLREPIAVSIELRQLTPSRIEPGAARRLFPEISQVDPNALLVRVNSDVWISADRPEAVDSSHQSCEAALVEPPVVRIDPSCLANWRLQFNNEAVVTTCCARPRYHGPPRSGHYPEDCVPVPRSG